MGRKRAAFPEGIAEEDQWYAQVPRDIRDLRGETQQALGRLLGWSVSMVSRFEAAAERLDEATHRRYCALAPTEELRERAMTAYEALPASPERHAAPVRMSPEEWHGRALDGPGLYQFFAAAYPGYPLLRLFGDQAQAFTQCGPSRHHPSSGRTSRPHSGHSTSHNRRPTCAAGTTGSAATPAESGTSSGAWRTGTASSTRSTPASGSTSDLR